VVALIVAGFHSQAEASRRGCNEHPQACTPTGDAVRALAYRRAERNAAVLPHSMQVEFWMSPTAAARLQVNSRHWNLDSKAVPMAPIFRRSANLASKVTLLLLGRPVLAARGRLPNLMLIR
jgi:hypothetical protein